MGNAETQEAQVLTYEQWRQVLEQMVPEARDDPLRRRAPRHGVKAMLHTRVVYQYGTEPESSLMALLTQVSDGGVTLRGRERVREGTCVRVEVQLGSMAFALRGCVMHCTQTLAAFKLGVQLLFDDPD